MKALIIDYTDASLLLLPIPEDREADADDYVREHPAYDDSCCYHIVTSGDYFPVYDIIRSESGDCWDYDHKLNL